jgi:hypothetical protein
MPDVFLSYSREDQATARHFAAALERAGFSVWWDQALNPGEAFDQVTEQALEQARAVIVLWSKTSVQSRWVRAEATQANASERLVPVMIEPCKRPMMIGKRAPRWRVPALLRRCGRRARDLQQAECRLPRRDRPLGAGLQGPAGAAGDRAAHA